jgi:uracil phosphoribosyltransferase
MVKILDHPLIQHKISMLRDENTGSKEFREFVREIANLMTYEATRDIPLKQVSLKTPMGLAKTNVITGRKIAFVPILRAGLGMLEGSLSLIPAAKVGHIGVCRQDETSAVSEYYSKLPFDINERDVILMDLMVARGQCASAALDIVKKARGKSLPDTSIKLMCVLIAREGLEYIRKNHPDVEIYVGAIDETLNKNGYILPGMGDGGDRIFGTK